jgi:chemotaxis response regulator CheB
MDGLEFLSAYRKAGGEAPVIVMTAYGSMDLAVEAMQAGAYDYLPKPFGADEVLLTLRKAEEREMLRREVGRLREEVTAGRRFGDIVAAARRWCGSWRRPGRWPGTPPPSSWRGPPGPGRSSWPASSTASPPAPRGPSWR